MNIPAAAQRRTLLVGIVLLAAFTVLALLVVNDPALTRADLTISRWFAEHRTQPITAVAWFLTWVGGVVGMTALTIIGTCCLLLRGKRFEAGLLAAAMIVQGLAVTLIKLVVARPRPPQQLWAGYAVYTRSFPSGHTTATMVFFGIIALLATRYVVRIVCLLGILGVAFSRVYLGYHYVSDVVGGWLLGGGVLALTALVWARRGVQHRATVVPPVGQRHRRE